MALDIYSTTQLLPVVSTIKPQTYFFRDSFFGTQINFTTQTIAFEELPTEQRLAPFVSPQAQGRIMRMKGRTSKVFAPAYVKPKHEIDPNMNVIVQRSAGEAIGGSLTMQQRWDAAVANTLTLQSDMIDRREEWMCAQAIINGGVTVQGEDYPAVYIDYGRDPSLTTVLTGTARWGQSASAALTNIGALRTAAFRLSSRPVSDIIMGLDAFALFFADPQVQDMLAKAATYRVTTSDSQLASFSDGSTPLEYRGLLQGPNGQGALRIWTYAQTYEDYDGTIQNVMNPLDVVGIGASVDGFMCYGAIKDSKAQLRPLARFPKMWEQEDPSTTYTMTQSSPLPVPTRPNASFRIRVA
jgi:hypothetical protein